MDTARARRLQPVFQRLGVTEIGLLVDEIEALEGMSSGAVPAFISAGSMAKMSDPYEGIPEDEMAELRAAQARRRAREARAAI